MLSVQANRVGDHLYNPSCLDVLLKLVAHEADRCLKWLLILEVLFYLRASRSVIFVLGGLLLFTDRCQLFRRHPLDTLSALLLGLCIIRCPVLSVQVSVFVLRTGFIPVRGDLSLLWYYELRLVLRRAPYKVI